jgi:16S rRNA (guanine1207-N2)-methyltransferase
VGAIIYGLGPSDFGLPAGAPSTVGVSDGRPRGVAGCVQCSPLIPGAAALADLADVAHDAALVHAPPGTLERRHVLAHVLRALAPGAPLTAIAANDRGGTRLAAELTAFGCAVETASRRHHRIVTTVRPTAPIGLAAAIADGAPRLVPDLTPTASPVAGGGASGLWTQPGVFSWDRIDPGTRLLLDHLPPLAGRGADLGCGLGVLARAIEAAGTGAHLTLVDIDARALAMAARNVRHASVALVWADVRTARDLPTGLDFVVTNPPFHDGGAEDRVLGHAFIACAARLLRPGGVLWLTANRHLPYEATLAAHFTDVDKRAEAGGYKVYRAVRPAAARASRSGSHPGR